MLGIEGSTFTSDTGIDRGTYGGKSLVLDGSADYLSQTLGTPTDNNVFTYSVWVKRSTLGSEGLLFEGYATDTNNRTTFLFDDTTNTLRFLHLDGGSVTDDVITSAVYRDTHAFMHIVLAVNTDEATASDRVKIYVDGIQETAFGTTNYPASGQAYDMNSATTHTIGIGAALNTSTCFHGYYAKIDFIDGQQLTPSSFGHTSADTGKWVASNTSGLTFGTNGFSLDFNDDRSGTPDTTTTIYDQSGNSNNWTGNSLVAGSFTGDTPVDNYCTMNPLDTNSGITLSLGNLKMVSASAAYYNSMGTMKLPKSGKFYWEQVVDTTTGSGQVSAMGIIQANTSNKLTNNTNTPDGVIYETSVGSTIYSDTTRLDDNTIGAISATSVMQIAIDLDNNKMWFGLDNAWYDSTPNSTTQTGNPSTGANAMTTKDFTGEDYIVYMGGYNGDSTANFGAEAFNFTPPTDFLPLSSANLPVPDELYRKPQNFADILLYTGDGVAIGSGGNAVTGAAFTPDLTWIKNRDAADSHQWTDIVRGVTKNLSSDSTAVEGTDTEGLTSFTSGGFTVGSDVSYNTNTEDYWAMCLKADNTSGASNTDGTETTTVSAGDFFSIVTYTGTAAVDTFGHGLGKTPDLILIKHRSGTFGWMVYHSSNTSAPETDYLQLNTTAATADLAGFLNDTAPTSSVFTLGTNTTANTSGGTYVAYCFVFDTTDANSPFTGGAYTGNGSADGTFIPSDEVLMFLIKRTDATANWQLVDQLRNLDTDGAVNDGVDVARLIPDTSNAENAASLVIFDFLSNGIKLRGTTTVMNASGGSYVWFGIKKNGSQLWA